MSSHPSPAVGAGRQRGFTARVVASLTISLGVGALLPTVTAGAAEAAVGLGTATSYGVLAGSTVTNTGPTTVNGDLGLHHGTAVTGSPAVTGQSNVDNPAALQAKDDLSSAFTDAAGRSGTPLASPELGGTTLTPGVYSSGTFQLTGTLTLDTLGDPNAVFIFQAASTLTTAPGSSVVVLNGATACNVFFQIGSSAVLDTNTSFVGTILASESISARTGTTVRGRLLAMTSAVTLDTNTITVPTCAQQVTTTSTTAPTTTSTTAPTTTSTTVSTTTTTTTSAPTTSAPTTTSTVLGGTSSTPGSGSGAPTTARATPTGIARSGPTTPGGSTSTTTRLARTGIDERLPAAGATLIGAGVLLLWSSKGPRRRLNR